MRSWLTYFESCYLIRRMMNVHWLSFMSLSAPMFIPVEKFWTKLPFRLINMTVSDKLCPPHLDFRLESSSWVGKFNWLDQRSIQQCKFIILISHFLVLYIFDLRGSFEFCFTQIRNMKETYSADLHMYHCKAQEMRRRVLLASIV